MTESHPGISNSEQHFYDRRLQIMQRIATKYGQYGGFAIGMMCGWMTELAIHPLSGMAMVMLENMDKQVETFPNSISYNKEKKFIDILSHNFRWAFANALLGQENVTNEPLDSTRSSEAYVLAELFIRSDHETNTGEKVFSSMGFDPSCTLWVLQHQDTNGKKHEIYFGSVIVTDNISKREHYGMALDARQSRSFIQAYKNERIIPYVASRISVVNPCS